MWYKSIANKYFLRLLTGLLFSMAPIAYSAPIQLQHNNTLFPVTINFPAIPQSTLVANPALPGSNIFLFVNKDTVSTVTFAVSITTIPKNAGSIPRKTAEVMIAETLDSQVTNADNVLGVKSEVTNESSTIPEFYPSKTIEVWRQTKPPHFGRYASFMVDRLLVTVFASGLSSRQNRDAIRSFVSSVVVHQTKERSN